MTISEIKNLTKYLTDEEVDKIKNEIKNKESVLKKENMTEEEAGQVLNTLFAILVIEKTLESEIEEIEDLRAELEQELMEAYQTYDSYMIKYKREEKKKKKRWLLDFLLLSERVSSRKESITASNKVIDSLKKELNTIKQQKSNENLKNVMRDVHRHGPLFDDFCKRPHECHNPFHHHEKNLEVHERMAERRMERLRNDVERRRNTRPQSRIIVTRPQERLITRVDEQIDLGEMNNTMAPLDATKLSGLSNDRDASINRNSSRKQ